MFAFKGKDKNKNNMFNIFINIFVTRFFILALFSFLLYLKPDFLNFILHTNLGNLLLIIGLTSIWFINKKLSVSLGLSLGVSLGVSLAIGLGLIFIIYLIIKNRKDNRKKEGFNDKPWSQYTIDTFKEFQAVSHPDIKYDIHTIQKQATEEEVQELIQTGKWPWSEEIQKIYKSAIYGTSNISIDPGIALSNAQSIYNETAIKQILSWGTKEGTFLISGAVIGHPENMPENINNLLRCGTSKDDSSSSVMQKTEYLGYNGINSSMDKRVTDVSNSDIPKLVTGFSFINDECNPCLPLNDNPDYSCPFKLDTGNGTEVSDVWKILWNLST
jgi:hypothetical protein